MDNEPLILAALNTITDFVSVRYIVQGANDDQQPQELPFVVFTTGEKDFEGLQTMCGVNQELFFQEFVVQIYSGTAEHGRSLTNQTIAALSGIGMLSGSVTEFEPDLRAYISTVNFS
jgi:hypothetical protein